MRCIAPGVQLGEHPVVDSAEAIQDAVAKKEGG
jgi:hypothetical protein